MRRSSAIFAFNYDTPVLASVIVKCANYIWYYDETKLKDPDYPFKGIYNSIDGNWLHEGVTKNYFIAFWHYLIFFIENELFNSPSDDVKLKFNELTKPFRFPRSSSYCSQMYIIYMLGV